MTFDEIRAAQPALGFALYALESGGPVTLEIVTPDGQVFPFVGPSATAVLTAAFPPDDAQAEPEHPEPTHDIFS